MELKLFVVVIVLSLFLLATSETLKTDMFNGEAFIIN